MWLRGHGYHCLSFDQRPDLKGTETICAFDAQVGGFCFDQRPDLKGTETPLPATPTAASHGFDQRPDLKGTETERNNQDARRRGQASINDPI